MEVGGRMLALLTKFSVMGAALMVVGLLMPGPVDAQTPPTAYRYFSASSVPAGGELVVTVSARGYGRFGQVVETLPAGFTYVPSDQPGVASDGQEVVAHFLRNETVTYRVTAPAAVGVGSFSGVLMDEDKAEHQVGGQSRISTTMAVGLSLLDGYDTNPRDGAIGQPEFDVALRDYLFDGTLDQAGFEKVLRLYLFG